MPSKRKISELFVRSGNGRSAHLQEHSDGLITLAFNRPIQREHVENGRLIQPEMVSRRGNKRVVAIALDDTSAEAAYQLLSKWRKDRERTIFMFSLFYRCISLMERRPRWFR